MEKLTRDQRDRMRNDLAKFRLQNQAYCVGVRLRGVPFGHTAILFRVDWFPCVYFGKQLVLKIIDELLDGGEGGEGGEET